MSNVEMSDSTVYVPKVITLATSADVDEFVANALLEQIRQKPTSVLTLPTGGTPLGVYRRLVQAYQAGQVNFSQLKTCNLDEYWPIAKTHPSSYAYYMQENLFSKVNVPPQSTHIPNGEAKDAEAEAKRYRELLDQLKIDMGLITLGPGETCHIGFNERGSALESRVRYVELDDETKQANERFFDNVADMPQGAITQGVADILAPQRILFVATGAHKAWGVQRSLKGEISSDAPASFLRYHPNVTVILDQAAAGLLQ